MRENDLSLQLALKAQKPQGRIRAANAKCRFETIRQKDPTATRPIWSADVGRRARLCSRWPHCWDFMGWTERARFRVRDEKGGIHIVIEMSDETGSKPSNAPLRRLPSTFYFLLEGQDLRRASEDTFVNLTTGEILVRMAD